jgi:transcriptional regulator with PAS, ATPase and Fis domain
MQLSTNLLRPIETGEIVSLGDQVYKSVDVRIIAAISHNPESNRLDSRLRKDLFYRISSVRIFLPPLRDTSEDVDLLAYAFHRVSCTKHYKRIHRIEPDVISILKSHDRPGNVRELKSAIEFAVCATDSDTLCVEHLPDHIRDNAPEKQKAEKSSAVAVKEMEKIVIRPILEENRGRRTHAAKAMGLSRTTFYRKCKKYGLAEPPHRTLVR